MPSLTRKRDGAGDSGSMSMAIFLDENNKECVEQNARPRVGVQMRVGSSFARTMTYQDWWQTTTITKVVVDTENLVVFKTKNSVYEWRP